MVPVIIIFLTAINLINGIDVTTNENYTQIEPRIIQPNSKQFDSVDERKEEIARLFVQDYRRTLPVVLLIDNTKESHEEAAMFMKNLKIVAPNSAKVNFMLMIFNASGVSPVLETTSNNRDRFEDLLGAKVEEPSAILGERYQNKSAALFGVLNAARLLPQNTGIIVFLNRGINDETLAQHALRGVSQKSIKVYVIWGGRYPSPRGEERILKELAQNTGGLFIPSPAKRLSEDWYHEFLENNIDSDVSILVTRKNLRGSFDCNFPIDSDVTSFHISVSPPSISKLLLKRPQGGEIDGLSEEDVGRFTSGSFLKSDTDSLEVHLNTTTATTRDVGIWRLFVEDAHHLYNLTIFAHTKLTTNAAFALENSTAISEKGQRRHVKLGVNGDISLITNISLVNKDGQPIPSNVKFTLDKNWDHHLASENLDEIEVNLKKGATIDVETIPDKSFYVVVDGKDSKGDNVRRLSYVSNSRKDSKFVIPLITVEVGLSSQLIAQPRSQPEIIFEVTNNGNVPSLVQFICKDTESLLLSMNPWFKWIGPQETANVRVVLTTKVGSYRDRITFVARGTEVASKEVYVDVGMNSQDSNDNTQPTLDHVFTSDCTNNLFESCESGSWSVEIKAKDTKSGLLQLTSTPRGIIFPHGFVTGTTDEVVGYFSESCCNPDLQIVAVDRLQNRRSYNINAYRANLSPGSIAAIILGILLLILIIVVIVWLIRRSCCKTTKASYDLPNYRGPSSSSRKY